MKCYKCKKYGHMAQDCRSSTAHFVAEEPGYRDAEMNDGSSCTSEGGRRQQLDFDVDSKTQQTAYQCVSYLGIMTLLTARVDEWFLDSGASEHMTPHREVFSNYTAEPGGQVSSIFGGQDCIRGHGEVKIRLSNNQITLSNVLYVPNAKANLIALDRLANSNLRAVFELNYGKVYDRSLNKLLFEAQLLSNGIYRIADSPINPKSLLSVERVQTQQSAPRKLNAYIWHRRLAHINVKYLDALVKGAATGILFDQKEVLPVCEPYIMGKTTRQPFLASDSRADGILDLVHSDLCYVPHKSLGGVKNIFTILDDDSWRNFVFFLPGKAGVTKLFQYFLTFIQNQTSRRVKSLRTDNVKEYVNQELLKIIRQNGIHHTKTIPHNPEQNGRAERLSRALLEKCRCMLHESKLGQEFWAEAVATASHMMNKTPCRAIGYKTPEEVWTKIKPDLSRLRIFGCQ